MSTSGGPGFTQPIIENEYELKGEENAADEEEEEDNNVDADEEVEEVNNVEIEEGKGRLR